MGDDDRTTIHVGPTGGVKPDQGSDKDASSAATPTRPGKMASFAEQIALSGRHPVLLFGTGESGKSTLLISLLNSMAQNERRINIALGERIFSRGDDEAEAFYQRAIEFYERYTQDFAQGAQLPQTAVEKPFFIPIDVRPAEGPPVRLAFLESNGDWLRPIGGNQGALFNELRPEIVDLLKHFGANISILYVAPYSIAEAMEGSTRESDTGLSGAIAKYEACRNLPERDAHLFLLTKWDTFAEPLRDDPKFSHVDDDEVAQILKARFAQSWSRFKNLPIKVNSGRRFFMQYASGHIVGGVVRQPPPRHRDTFDRYPRSVWNWIYANALEAQSDGGSLVMRRRGVLFPEVLPVTPPPLSVVDRIYAMLRGR